MFFSLFIGSDHTGAFCWMLGIIDRRGAETVPVSAALSFIPETDTQPPAAVLISARSTACDYGYQLPAPGKWKQVGPTRYEA